MGYALNVGRSWTGDVLVADIEELHENGASELYLRRIKEKEVIVPKDGDTFIFLIVVQ